MMKETIDYYTLGRPEVVAFVPKDIKKILDIGTGQGFFLKSIKEKTGSETWGIEMDSQVAEKAKQQADHILTGRVEDVLGSIPEGYFDCITFNDVLEHTLEPGDILKMIKPKLSPNGIIIASIPNVRYFFNLYEVIIKKEWEYKDNGILDSTHLRFFTQKSMVRMFNAAGYNSVEQTGINEIKTWKFQLFNLLTLGRLSDTKYLQFINIAK